MSSTRIRIIKFGKWVYPNLIYKILFFIANFDKILGGILDITPLIMIQSNRYYDDL